MIEKQNEFIKRVFEKLGYDKKYAVVSFSSRKELCDFQINSVFSLSKDLKENPILIGEKIVKAIKNEENVDSFYKEVTFVRPGFINLIISDRFIGNCLNELKNNDINFDSKNKTAILDFGGPNMAKTLHVGHLRSPLIGMATYNILKKVGYNVISDVHLGDMGLQMGEIIYGLQKENIKPENVTMEDLNRIYPMMNKIIKEDESVLTECQNLTLELQTLLKDNTLNDEKNILAYHKTIYDNSLKSIKELYKFLGVDFDLWYGEKDALKYVDDLIKYMQDKGLTEVDNGALIVRLQTENDNKTIPPLMLRLVSGASGYQTSDLATLYGRVKEYHPDEVLYFVDKRQSLHFEQVFRASNLSGLTKGVKLLHCPNGTINGKDGKPFKTRSGDTVKLEDLFKEVKETFISKKDTNKEMDEIDQNKITRAIINYAELSNNREKDYIFDIAKFSDVQGKTGPYILYTALRIRKILKENNFVDSIISNNIYNEIDRDLRMKLLEAKNVIEKAASEYSPHHVAEYLYDLSVLTNTFYQNNNIGSLTDEEKKSDWLNLLSITYKIMEELLTLLMIELPSKM